MLDALADKVLMLAVVITLTLQGLLPWWLLLLALARDLVIGAGALAYRFFVGPYTPEPTFVSKVNTTLLIVLIIAVLAQQTALPVPALVVQGLLWTILATLLVSGVGYVSHWGRRAYKALSEPPNRF
ncbi:hypothetical protein CAI21_04985 [Alkalilimnicola ehrlichii]|uniref:CDP-alcohol phosphatidyltransferase n=1 Tax=Alkalilimnicola ehrlichii TaxID=351052 RepID=A0A3E0X164_9GAMM|nr:CDP-alcohol phosphatidyltransferase family protein [Alkalilimnicola ehrlichii]RFA30433.1 hypothetical protein CAI21_04985 [Alkalilimnicola ehrlichii]RFA37985.1 hypothetical protein CAL65_06360 [Alkalilimnicola ehrlichii]